MGFGYFSPSLCRERVIKMKILHLVDKNFTPFVVMKAELRDMNTFLEVLGKISGRKNFNCAEKFPKN